MLIIVAGTYSSGSTWLFNVIRSIVATLNENAVSCYCESAEQVLHVSQKAEHLVVKSHALDRNLINLVGLTKAKIVITSRDPRDSYVSLLERFNFETQDLVDKVARSITMSAIARIKTDCLFLSYEDNFTENPETITRVSEYIGTPISKRQATSIFKRYHRNKIKAEVSRLTSAGQDSSWFDPATHWHPGHIGDGRVGKWSDTLTSEWASALHDALEPYHSGDFRRDPIVWRANLFRFCDLRDVVSMRETLQTGTHDGTLVFGPYLYLPSGRWRAEFLISALDQNALAFLKIDICDSGAAVDVLAMRKVHVGERGHAIFDLEFDHDDHLRPIEARVHAVRGAAAVAVTFSGVRFSWLGDTVSDPGGAVTIRPDVKIVVEPARA